MAMPTAVLIERLKAAILNTQQKQKSIKPDVLRQILSYRFESIAKTCLDMDT